MSALGPSAQARPTAALLRRLLIDVERIRRVEERIAELYAEQEMRCPVHLCIGQEAASAGVSAALEVHDTAVSGHRAHGHYLAKGGDLNAMIAEIYGKATGCASGRGGSMHLIDLKCGFLGSTPIVGGTVPVGVGAAYAMRLRGERSISVVYLGDAAVEEGVFHESLNFAALKQLPVLFVCENNLYSVYTRLDDRQPARPLHRLAAAHGIPALVEDGNDAVAVYERAAELVDKVRGGAGPAFLELPTYRWREHCGPNYDQELGYRPDAEYADWKKLCPVERLRERCLREGVVDAAELKALQERLEAEIDEAFRRAKQAAYPEPGPSPVYAGNDPDE
ncbi:MAG: Acetoin:2,6-dichlorophenolindophenol oxidoreductase subunit alpha [Candidatus Omnitrophica bacterium]|nr:Acetoin:2,6-dichlorophenolindophenol oxidoreductase subunit alpha [Candidatus Omnitrophota bacterium]